MDDSENLVLQFNKLEMIPNQTIPIDIIADILLRLPAKPLLRFKSVCKSWYYLISDYDFVKRHLNKSLATQSNLHIAVRKPVLHLADFDTFDNAIELDYPFKKEGAPGGGASILGSYHGLLCLWDMDYYAFNVALYNPTTRTFKLLPFQPRTYRSPNLYHHFTYGFGYDSVFDDYKFVRIFRCSDKESTFSYCEVMVYSLKMDLWMRVLDHVPYKFSSRQGDDDGAFVNGSLHWVLDTGLDDPPFPIVGFNISTNSFFEVQLPEFDMDMYCFMHVGVLDGCLCIMLNYLDEHEIWIMKEYGVVESWSKLCRAKKARDGDIIRGLVGYTRNRKELLIRLCLNRVTSLNLETLEIESVEPFGNPPSRRWDAHVCVENLLMLDDFIDDFFGDEQQEGQKKTKKRRRKRRRRKNKRN